MGIWLETENASENWHIVGELFQSEKFIGNDLSLSARKRWKALKRLDFAMLFFFYPFIQ